MGFLEGMFPEAERYYSQAISLPMFAGMTEGQQDRVVDALITEMKRFISIKDITH
jgi:dTDP-4-amino-4,6-dideoxygalactose transaminase